MTLISNKKRYVLGDSIKLMVMQKFLIIISGRDKKWLDMSETWTYVRETNPTSDATFAPGYFVTKIYDYITGDYEFVIPVPDIHKGVLFHLQIMFKETSLWQDCL